MKKLVFCFALTVFLSALLVIPAVSAETMESGTCGDDLTWMLDSEGTLTISGEGEMFHYDSGEYISPPWESLKDRIKAVVIENGVTTIGSFAFSNCTDLSSAAIPDSVKYILEEAFCGCSGLSSVDIPDSVTTLSVRAFSGCTGLTSVTIPDSVTYLDIDAFSGCTGMTSVIIGKNVTSKGGAFSGCTGLTNITILNGVTSIAKSDFSGCTGLTGIVIPDGITSIGEYAFSGCSSLKSMTIPDSVTSIGESAFSGCSAMRNITVAGTGEIKWGSPDWSGMKSVTVTIEPGITGIMGSAFLNFEGLTAIEIPDTMTSIGLNAFDGCTGLKGVYISDLAAWGSIRFSDNPLENAHALYLDGVLIKDLIIPSGITVINGDVFHGCSELISIKIPDGVTVIEWCAFEGCTGLTSVEIPSGTTRIEENAFYGCSGLTSVTIPPSVKKIADVAFYGCDSISNVKYLGSNAQWNSITIEYGNNALTSAEIEFSSVYQHFGKCGSDLIWTLDEEGTLTISGEGRMYGYYAYDDDQGGLISGAPWKALLSQIKTVVIEKGAETIGSAAFCQCSELTGITIPESIQNIEQLAFFGCDSLTGVYITDLAAWCGVRFQYESEIGTEPCNPLFYAHNLYLNGELVTNLVIPDSVTGIGDRAFNGCSGLISVNIPGSVDHIGKSTFSGCSGLKRVVISDSVKTIGKDAFSGCSELTSVYIPDSVQTIGEGAFSNCIGLTSIDLSDSVQSIGDRAFYCCKGLTSVTIPDTLQRIEGQAFDGCDSLSWVVFNGTEEQWAAVKVGDGNDLLTCASFVFGDVFSGSCGEDLSYSFDADSGTLTITGSGAMTDYAKKAPWVFFEEKITSLVMPDGITAIGSHAFDGCCNLAVVSLPDSVEDMGQYAFRGCSLLKTAGPADGGYDIEFRWRRTIPDNAFYGAESLEEITFPDRLLKIGNAAFCGCTALNKMIVPDELEVIGDNVISGCLELDSLGTYGSGCALEIPWNDRYLDIFLRGNRNIKRVIMPEDVTELGDNFFRGCTGLEEFTAPPRMETIGQGAFSGCISLKNVTLSTGLRSIGDSAFSSCTGLKSIVISTGLQSIGVNAFSGCTGLTSVVLPTGLQSIGKYAFSGCSSLETVNLPEGLSSLGGYAFSGCTSLKAVTVPGILGTVEGLFSGCTGLGEVRISNGTTLIRSSAFSGCSNLRTVYIPRSVNSIEERAFYDCEKLWDVYYSGRESDWKAMYIGEDNRFLTTADIHYSENPVGDADADIVSVDMPSGEGGNEVEASVYCAPDADVTALGVLYAKDGRFLGAFTIKLLPGLETEMLIPVGDAYIVRIFSLSNSNGFPVTPTTNIAIG